jgi:hypothetical protein
MNHNVRKWNVLNWNIRGLNDEGKARVVRQTIEESCCSIFCTQETKMEAIIPHSFQRLAPRVPPNSSLVPLEVPWGVF